MQRNLNILFTIGQQQHQQHAPSAMKVNFLRLAVELMRVVRDVAQPLRRDLSTITTVSSVAAESILSAAAIRFGNKLRPATIALLILGAIFDHDSAFVSDADSTILVSLSRDLNSVVASETPHGNSALPHFRFALATTWMALGSLVAAIARRSESTITSTTTAGTSNSSPDTAVIISDTSICTAALRALSGVEAWSNSGKTLFLAETYITSLSRIVQTLLWLPLFHTAFDNTIESAAKLVWTRIAARPPLTIDSATSPMSPTLTHGVMFLASQIARALDRVLLSSANPPKKSERAPLHLYQKRTTTEFAEYLKKQQAVSQVPHHHAVVAASGNAVTAGEAGLFQWLALAVSIPTETPSGLTADPEALMSLAQRTSFAELDDAKVRAAVRPSLLQALVAYIRDCTCVPVSNLSEDVVLVLVEAIALELNLSEDVVLVLVEAIALELLQLRVQSLSEVHTSIASVNPTELMWRLVQSRCETDLNFFTAFVKRIILRFAKEHFERAHTIGGKITFKDRQGEFVVQHCQQVYFCFGPPLSWLPMEMLDASLASDVLTSLTYLAPLLLVLVGAQPVWLGGGGNAPTTLSANGSSTTNAANKRNPERDRLLRLYNSSFLAATALSSRLDRERGAAIIQRAKQCIAKVSQYSNFVYSSHIEVMLAALRSPVLCGKMSEESLLQDWSALVLPILNGQNDAPVPLQSAAHDCMIAPILSKRAKGLIMIPTYVAMFCPVQGISQRYPAKHVNVIRSFSKTVRSVVDQLEKLDVNDDILLETQQQQQQQQEGPATKTSPANAIALATAVAADLTPLSAILLIVQGLFDQIRLQLQQGASTPTQEQSQRQDLYISGLVNLLQCSNPKVTSRVCTSIEVLVLEYLGHNMAFQERVLTFASSVVQTTANDSVKKPVGEWLLRLTKEARVRRQAGHQRQRSKL
ncbi:Hypothetical protein, putative [Bodo saltans]|uniref:Uncharacterized protein n=1 Tax=Bodo saltans TaxID=75058 RepID=A0A0S4J6Z2_BODSA|nr:Hypothetical protein, putative [Bodo saltans]|eukprot:CUG72736.1 Hypothetical protein, putative [Bodo saltans]